MTDSHHKEITHGAFARLARDRLDAKEREVFDALALDAPLRDPDGSLPAPDAAQVRLLAECLSRIEDVGGCLRDHGLIDPKTKAPRESVIALEARLRNDASDYLDALGMSPRSRARLGLDLQRQAAFDLASYWSEDDAIEGEADE